jgi:glucose/arabinose dehydrogenase
MKNSLLKNKYLIAITTKLLVLMASGLCLSFAVYAAPPNITFKSEGMEITVERVAKGLNIPWGMTFLSATKLLVTEREGQILLLNLKQSTKTILKNIPNVMAEGQGGMLDIALSPNYKNNGWIYFTYVKDIDGEGATVLARAKLKQNRFYKWQELLVSESTTDTSRHFGSRIAFDKKGHVFFGIGDRGERPNAQDLTNHAGSIMRLNLDGSIPNDNPYVNSKTILTEIWSYGHRNPQGLAYDHKFNRLWEIEHGPRGGDEINFIKKGANYGWPIISYGKEYWGPLAIGEGTHRQGMEQPVKVYVPSIAPGSLLIYSGNAFPKWQGNLFSGALKLRHINRIVLNKKGEAINEERLLKSLDNRIRALTQSPEGWIYFSTDSGEIYRIRPNL